MPQPCSWLISIGAYGFCSFDPMTLLKLVRDNQRAEPHLDSLEDLVAYSSLYGESRLGAV